MAPRVGALGTRGTSSLFPKPWGGPAELSSSSCSTHNPALAWGQGLSAGRGPARRVGGRLPAAPGFPPPRAAGGGSPSSGTILPGPQPRALTAPCPPRRRRDGLRRRLLERALAAGAAAPRRGLRRRRLAAGAAPPRAAPCLPSSLCTPIFQIAACPEPWRARFSARWHQGRTHEGWRRPWLASCRAGLGRGGGSLPFFGFIFLFLPPHPAVLRVPLLGFSSSREAEVICLCAALAWSRQQLPRLPSRTCSEPCQGTASTAATPGWFVSCAEPCPPGGHAVAHVERGWGCPHCPAACCCRCRSFLQLEDG